LRIVLDTNVLVSGLLSPFGPPADVVRLVAAGALSLGVDARILEEYRLVLARPRFGFDGARVGELLAQIDAEGVRGATRPLRLRLPDPYDEPFLEVALAVAAEALVTGNVRHFPPSRREGVRVLSPRAFVEEYRARQGAGRPPLTR
jgi:putative PIN family toxin of toxin-antitoxin system